MVDVGAKSTTERFARARVLVRLAAGTESALKKATLVKGDAFVTAQLAGIMAAKQTSQLIPLTHPIPLSSVSVDFKWVKKGLLQIDATARTTAQTGVEMEALTAAAIAALTIYDMTKAIERGITIESLQLIEKSGGKSGPWKRSK
jgi:cyclic pyranopterin phosphate synthase